jgi:uncharacterized membrane protein YccC
MTDVFDGQERARPNRTPARLSTTLLNAASAAGPALLFGLRLWASVCFALYVAFWLQLDNPSWAGTSAAIMCQPQLGASLRKGWYRMIGTFVGAAMIVVLTALFVQQRALFLLSLALWAAGCALVATLLRNFAAYAAALAGYTAAIIAADSLGSFGGPNSDVFLLAVTRASEICIGIVCAGIVLAGTDLGGAQRRLAALFVGVIAEIANRFTSTLALAGPNMPETQPIRRELVRRTTALDPVIDLAIGESSELRVRSSVLQTAVDGLLAAVTGWRVVAMRLGQTPDSHARQEADFILQNVPQELRSTSLRDANAPWMTDPVHLRQICEAAVRNLLAAPAATPSLRLLADQTAKVWAGISEALSAVALLLNAPAQSRSRRHPGTRLFVPDWLPSLFNAARAFLAIGVVALFWIITAWPNGAGAITFAAVVVLLFTTNGDQAPVITMNFMVGTALAVVFTAIIEFALLPGVETFVAFSIIIALYLIPLGALMTQTWQLPMFTAMTILFVPLLAPTNQMTFDTAQFYNTALAIIGGAAAGALSFRLLPPLPPAFRARRLLALTLRDLLRLAARPTTRTPGDWEARMYGRLSALPDAAEPLQRSQLVASLALGTEIIQLRHMASRLGLSADTDAAFAALARGNSTMASSQLVQLDHRLAARADTEPESPLALRARASILAILDALNQHAAFFDAGARR